MEIVVMLCFIFIVILFILININNNRKAIKRKLLYMENYKNISLGMSYSDIVSMYGNGILKKEKTVKNNIISEYVWYLGWYNKNVTVSTSYSKSSVRSSNRYNKSLIELIITFENGIVISKEQHGLFL